MFVTMYDSLRQYHTYNGHCPWAEVYNTSHTTFPLLTVLKVQVNGGHKTENLLFLLL